MRLCQCHVEYQGLYALRTKGLAPTMQLITSINGFQAIIKGMLAIILHPTFSISFGSFEYPFWGF